MKCPLKKSYENIWDGGINTAMPSPPDRQEAYFGECDGSECAWFCDLSGRCSITSIPGIAIEVSGCRPR